MDKKLFTNNIFKIIFIIIVGLDLFSAVIKISENSATTSISILKYINLIICLFALISFFIITKYSLSILKLYIVYRLINQTMILRAEHLVEKKHIANEK
jgi:hypothetical protein